MHVTNKYASLSVCSCDLEFFAIYLAVLSDERLIWAPKSIPDVKCGDRCEDLRSCPGRADCSALKGLKLGNAFYGLKLFELPSKVKREYSPVWIDFFRQGSHDAYTSRVSKSGALLYPEFLIGKSRSIFRCDRGHERGIRFFLVLSVKNFESREMRIFLSWMRSWMNSWNVTGLFICDSHFRSLVGDCLLSSCQVKWKRLEKVKWTIHPQYEVKLRVGCSSHRIRCIHSMSSIHLL